MKFTESTAEEVTLEWFQTLGYDYRSGPEIAHDGLFAEREGYEHVALQARLRFALARINPSLPPSAIDDAIKQITPPVFPTLVLNNRAFHKTLTDVPSERRPPRHRKSLALQFQGPTRQRLARGQSVPSPEAVKVRDDVGFFQAVKAQLAKIRGGPGGTTERDLDTAIKQLVSKSVSTDEVIDVFRQATTTRRTSRSRPPKLPWPMPNSSAPTGRPNILQGNTPQPHPRTPSQHVFRLLQIHRP
jgi:Domain of unknown function (DUF3387)